jgi:3-keto-5-aminohexanoate cleavage enzyme
MIAGLGVDLSELVGPAVARGVHVRAGLVDAPFGETRSNAQLIADMVRQVEAAGGRPASVVEVRASLAA